MPNTETFTQKTLTAISLSALFLMCSLPFLMPIQGSPVSSFYAEFMAIVLGVLASVFMLQHRTEHSLYIPQFILAPLSLIIILVLQISFGLANYWQQHALVALYLTWAIIIMMVAAQIKQQLGLNKIVPLLATALVIGGLVSFLTTVLAFADITKTNSILAQLIASETSGNLTQPSHLANYTGLALASLFYLWLSQRIKSDTTLLLALPLTFSLAFSGQAMAVVYLLVLSIGGWLLARHITEHNINIRANRLLSLIPAFIGWHIIIPLLPITQATMPHENLLATLQASIHNLQYSQQAWQIFSQHPLLGAGWGQFAWQNFLLTDHYPAIQGYSHDAHNLIFQLLAETGIFGAGIVLLSVILLIAKQCHSPITIERWWLSALLTILAVHSLLAAPFWYAYFLGIAALLIGLADNKPKHYQFRLLPFATLLILLIATLSLFTTQQHYQQVENWYSEGRRGNLNANASEILRDMSITRNKSLFAPYIDLIIVRALPDSKQVLADKLEMNSQLTRQLPSDVEVYKQVTLLAINDQAEAASRQLDLAMRHYPNYIDRYWKIATRGLLVGGHTQLYPLIQQLQDYQDRVYPIEQTNLHS